MDSHKVSDWITSREGLDEYAKPIQDVVGNIYNRDSKAVTQLENFLHGKWLGHPLHTALIHIPVGAWTVAAILDLFSRNVNARAASDWCIGIGLVVAIPAFITGLTDWYLYTSAAVRRIGLVHMAANFLAFLFYAISYGLRGGTGLVGPLLTGYLGFACLGVAGYLGGVMVYQKRIGVNHAIEAEDESASDEFVTVMRLSDLEDNVPTRVQVGATFAVVVKTADRIYALADKCSHEGGPLSEGTLVDSCLVCPWHSTAFRLEDGKPISGPGIFSQPVFEVYIREDEIRIKPIPAEDPTIASTPIVNKVSLI